MSVGCISDTSASSSFSSLVAAGSAFFAVLGCLLSLIASDNLLSTISDRLLSLVADDGPLSTVLDCSLSLGAGGSPLSTVSGRFLFFITYDSLLSPVSEGSFLSSISLASSWAFVLMSTLSYTHCSSLSFLPLFYSFLPSLLTPLTCNSTPFTKKRLFDQAFIT